MSKGIGLASAVLILLFVVVAVFTLSLAWSEIPIQTSDSISTIIPTLTSLLPFIALIVIVAMVIGIFISLVMR